MSLHYKLDLLDFFCFWLRLIFLWLSYYADFIQKRATRRNLLFYMTSETQYVGAKGTVYKSHNKLENTSLAVPRALDHCLQRCTAWNAAPPATPHRPLNPTWPAGFHKMAGTPINFLKINFFIRTLLL